MQFQAIVPLVLSQFALRDASLSRYVTRFVTGQWGSEIKYFDISSIVLVHDQDLIEFQTHTYPPPLSISTQRHLPPH